MTGRSMRRYVTGERVVPEAAVEKLVEVLFREEEAMLHAALSYGRMGCEIAAKQIADLEPRQEAAR